MQRMPKGLDEEVYGMRNNLQGPWTGGQRLYNGVQQCGQKKKGLKKRTALLREEKKGLTRYAPVHMCSGFSFRVVSGSGLPGVWKCFGVRLCRVGFGKLSFLSFTTNVAKIAEETRAR